MIVRGRRYDNNDCVAVETADGRVTSINPIADEPQLPWLAPGFIDLQVNGYGGIGFNDANLNSDHIIDVAKSLVSFGVTTFLPTVTSASFETIQSACSAIAMAREQLPNLQRCIAGIHLEGPYISPHDGPRGAHPREHVRPPDFAEFERWLTAARGLIRLITLSPEYEQAPEFIARVTAMGVVAAIGHTAANSEQIAAAVAAGARLSTHLGNGAHPLIKRHPNYIWDQLADDRLMASLIADGHHLPPAVVKTMLRAKTPERCILVSDMTNLAGCQPGMYHTEFGAVEMLDNGKLVIGGQREILAGASQPITLGIANVMRFAGLDLNTAIELATINPARLLNLSPPQIAVGSPAKLVVFHLDTNLEIKIEATIGE